MKKNYVGHEVTVSFDGDLCRHAAECVRGLPDVFNVDKHPWVQPDRALPSEVIEVVGRCPSGALRIESAPDRPA